MSPFDQVVELCVIGRFLNNLKVKELVLKLILFGNVTAQPNMFELIEPLGPFLGPKACKVIKFC